MLRCPPREKKPMERRKPEPELLREEHYKTHESQPGLVSHFQSPQRPSFTSILQSSTE